MSVILLVIALVALAVVQVLLVVAAFRTSSKLGILALFVPMFVASFGNHGLQTERRRALAMAWWLSIVGIIVAMAVSPR